MPPHQVTKAAASVAARRTADPKPVRPADTTIDDARRKRTQAYLAKERAREVELTAQGVCF